MLGLFVKPAVGAGSGDESDGALLDYLTYALQRYLIEHCNYTEKDAEIKVMQDFEEVEQEAREAGFL